MRVLLTLSIALLLVGCPSDGEPGQTPDVTVTTDDAAGGETPDDGEPESDVAEPAKDDGEKGDEGGVVDFGLPPSDEGLPPTDNGAPEEDSATPDKDQGVPPVDAGEPDLSTCEGILAQVDVIVPDMQACETADECIVFEHPICQTGGCFQRAVNKSADLTELSELANKGGELQCEPFHCGCDPNFMADCVEGVCTVCDFPGGCQ